MSGNIEVCYLADTNVKDQQNQNMWRATTLRFIASHEITEPWLDDLKAVLGKSKSETLFRLTFDGDETYSTEFGESDDRFTLVELVYFIAETYGEQITTINVRGHGLYFREFYEAISISFPELVSFELNSRLRSYSEMPVDVDLQDSVSSLFIIRPPVLQTIILKDPPMTLLLGLLNTIEENNIKLKTLVLARTSHVYMPETIPDCLAKYIHKGLLEGLDISKYAVINRILYRDLKELTKFFHTAEIKRLNYTVTSPEDAGLPRIFRRTLEDLSFGVCLENPSIENSMDVITTLDDYVVSTTKLKRLSRDDDSNLTGHASRMYPTIELGLGRWGRPISYWRQILSELSTAARLIHDRKLPIQLDKNNQGQGSVRLLSLPDPRDVTATRWRYIREEYQTELNRIASRLYIFTKNLDNPLIASLFPVDEWNKTFSPSVKVAT